MRSALICAASAAEVDRLKFMLGDLGFAEFLESSDTDRAVLLAKDHLPDLAIIDTGCRGEDLLSAIGTIRRGHPLPVILVAKDFEVGFLGKSGIFVARDCKDCACEFFDDVRPDYYWSGFA